MGGSDRPHHCHEAGRRRSMWLSYCTMYVYVQGLRKLPRDLLSGARSLKEGPQIPKSGRLCPFKKTCQQLSRPPGPGRRQGKEPSGHGCLYSLHLPCHAVLFLYLCQALAECRTRKLYAHPGVGSGDRLNVIVSFSCPIHDEPLVREACVVQRVSKALSLRQRPAHLATRVMGRRCFPQLRSTSVSLSAAPLAHPYPHDISLFVARFKLTVLSSHQALEFHRSDNKKAA
ncbi:hypothetical protein V8C42DRAFT_269735 [Trichoderma barbatum]